ncbi:NAD(P)-binding domain-containing protein [Amycolatopsis sp. QT-25]|uniref:NAD(P)-dependent oxidoreductase n=1 Tax=Amycolatopsis sp. QT-25 TaxID=3034022 RepID=UPI0023EB33AF|nr:NAD(P)-binding domain-containing protein [Amycolatopsis sp. QT-25]WET81020.1 NAD(P)-binding domain-containing protein [Amycolatopsis sp. QT-25]
MKHEKVPVSVLGTGRLGTALVAAFLAAGHPVTVWNRTSGKTAPLAANGATVAGSVAEAVAVSPLVLTVLLDHAAVRAKLSEVDLRDRTLLNISSSAPDDIRALAEWASGRGAAYLDAAVMALPQAVGTPDAQVLYSGSAAAFDRYGEQLAALGTSRYLAEDPGVAELYSIGLLSAGYGTLFGFLHGVALLDTAGMRPTDFLEMVVPWLGGMLAFLPELAREIETADYTSGESSLEINLRALEYIEATSRSTDVAPGFVKPALDLVRKRMETEGPTDSVAGVFEAMRRKV